jgi:hypothetical protein
MVAKRISSDDSGHSERFGYRKPKGEDGMASVGHRR